MTDYQIIRRYERIGIAIGAVVLGLIFLIISCLAPIDGVPGYQLITADDFSIVFGFAFAVLVGAGVGAIGGATLGRRYGRQKVAQSNRPAVPAQPRKTTPQSVPSVTPQPAPRVTPQPTPSAASHDHPLLDLLLSKMPPDTRQKVGMSFAAVSSNFEFFTWVPLAQTQAIADEANRRGFTVWGNTDATSAILYGAGSVPEDQTAAVVVWLRTITAPGAEKGTALVSQPGAPARLIEFDAAQN
jgi:hypothetical protein